ARPPGPGPRRRRRFSPRRGSSAAALLHSRRMRRPTESRTSTCGSSLRAFRLEVFHLFLRLLGLEAGGAFLGEGERQIGVRLGAARRPFGALVFPGGEGLPLLGLFARLLEM